MQQSCSRHLANVSLRGTDCALHDRKSSFCVPDSRGSGRFTNMSVLTQRSTLSNPNETREWLPGPPPRRRQKDLSTLQDSNCHEQDLNGFHIPIRKVDLRSFENRNSEMLRAYFIEGASTRTTANAATDKVYLFHGCAGEIKPDLLTSFSRYGPSIHFSRPQSYLSRGPAVYWTDSLDFAFAWCVFSETGRWIPDISPEASIECLIYVSRVKREALQDITRCYNIPVPASEQDEQELVDVSCSRQ